MLPGVGALYLGVVSSRGHESQCWACWRCGTRGALVVADTGSSAPMRSRTPVLQCGQQCSHVNPCSHALMGRDGGRGEHSAVGLTKACWALSFAHAPVGGRWVRARRGGPSPVAECRSRARPDPHRELATGTPLGEDMCRPQARHQVRICGEGRMKETGVGAGG